MQHQPTYEEIVARLAPCGIDCERCVMATEGRVKRLATELAEALRGFENMAERWRRKNDRMREVGVEQAYRESLQEPRY